MQIRGRKPKKQPIRAGGISASSPQATRGCAARCRGFAAFACARETQQYRQLRRLVAREQEALLMHNKDAHK